MYIPQDVKDAISSDEYISRKLLTIEFKLLSIPPLRILENETFCELKIGNNRYLGAPLKISDLSRSEDNEFQRIQAEISNVAQSISSLIGHYGDVITGSNCMVEEVFLDENFNIIANRAFPLFIGLANNLTLTAESAKMNIDTVLGGYSTQSPNMTYGVNCQWRKFKDQNCGYTGDVDFCDKTLTSCRNLSNLQNFGGFPSIPRQQVITG